MISRRTQRTCIIQVSDCNQTSSVPYVAVTLTSNLIALNCTQYNLSASVDLALGDYRIGRYVTSEAKNVFITSVNTDRYIESANDEIFITSVTNRIYIR